MKNKPRLLWWHQVCYYSFCSFFFGWASIVMAQEGLEVTRAIELKLDTLAGKTYELQSSTNLADWALEEQLTGTGSTAYRLKSLRGNAQRYYRLVSASAQTPADYFPISAGNRWVYDGGYGNGNRVDTILGTETVAGQQTYKWQRQEAAPDNYTEQRWLYKDNGDLKVAQMWGNEGIITTVTPFPAPWTWLKAKPAMLDSWTNEISMALVRVRMILTVQATGVQVTTPAGVFTNCIALRTHFEIIQGATTDQSFEENYFAPNIGLVESNDCNESWQVTHSQRLIEYSVKTD